MKPDPMERARNSPSWDVAAARWFVRDPSEMGVHQVIDAVKKKHLGLLRQALIDHPKVYRANFHRLDSKCNTLDRGRLSHLVLNLGWTAAFDVLWEAGDRFDQKSVDDGFSAPEFATFSAKTAALKRMLKLGVDPDAQLGRPLGQMFLLKNWQRDTDGKAAAVLVNGGADPWAPTQCEQGTLPLVMALLANNRNLSAEIFLNSAKHIPSHINAAEVSNCWLTGLHTFLATGALGRPDIYPQMLATLQDIGCPLPTMQEAVAAGIGIHQFAITSHEAHSLLMDMMLAQDGYTKEDLAAGMERAEHVDYEDSGPWKARLSALSLTASTPSPARASQSLRL